MLTSEEQKQAVEEFKSLFKEEFGIVLSDEEATEKSKGILQLIDSIIIVDLV
jgi:hypothetical protein